jgi:hypothetical protein
MKNLKNFTDEAILIVSFIIIAIAIIYNLKN